MHHWIGVDLDNTVAHFTTWKSCSDIGKPIPLMVDRIKQWLADGETIKILTARVCRHDERDECIEAIDRWCLEHFGQVLEITNEKDFGMRELWDDRAIRVESNTGQCMSILGNIDDLATAVGKSLVAAGYVPKNEAMIKIIRDCISEHLNNQ